MNKTTQLFIRACRTLHPRQRVRSVYKRFYLGDGNDDAHIVLILSELCDQHAPFKSIELMSAFDPQSYWYWKRDDEEPLTHVEICLNVLINKIRHTPVEKFEGLTTPRRFNEDA